MHEWALESVDGVWLLAMEDEENRIGATALREWTDALDRVESYAQPQPLVVTGTDRFWSTGLDLEEFESYSDVARTDFMGRFDQLLGRILTAPFVTVASLNGHTIAGGALLALAHDYRIMSEDHGYVSLPSVDVGIPFTRGMSALITAKVPQPAAHDLVVSCRQIGGREAHALGVITSTASSSDVVSAALVLAASLKDKDPETLRTVKQHMYAEATAALMGTP